MAFLTSLNMPPMAQMVLVVVVITLVLSAKHALVESMQKVTQSDVTNTAVTAATAAATASAAAAAAAASPMDSTAAEASAAAAAAAEEAASIAAETADIASASASSSSSAMEPVGASSRKRRTEMIVDQLGVTAGLLFLLLFIQLFYFLHDLGYITEPPVGTTAQQVFSYWKLGGFVLAEVARALSLVFLVGASYTTRDGPVKGMLIAATSLLFVELVSGKFEMGQAVCDSWYAARKTAATSQQRS